MKIYLIDEEQITLAHLLAHTSPNVRRHATGALKALQKNAERVLKEQDRRMNPNAPRCKACGLHPASCICLHKE